MSLRINHNTSSLNAQRSLGRNNHRAQKSLEKLSSGLAINTAGDAPAAMIASEQLRSQIASLEQAMKNAETSVSMVQTAEGALGEVNNMLVSMRSLAIHAANEGSNDAVMLEGDQLNIRTMLDSIDRIAQTTRFGTKALLDGSNGVSGIALGEGLEYVSATTKTRTSGKSGFDIVIAQEATKSSLMGTAALTQEMVTAGETLMITEGGKVASYTTTDADTVQSSFRNLTASAAKNGLAVDMSIDEAGIISAQHKMYGSEFTFQVSSSTAGVLSTEASDLTSAMAGQDIKGTINGEASIGQGDVMMGLVGNANTEGLSVRYRNKSGVSLAENATVGKLAVTQNALTFQVGPAAGNTVTISLPSIAGNQLGRGIENESGFDSLTDLDVRTAQGASDALGLVDQAIQDIGQMRAELGSVQKNTLETNIATLQATTENMVAAESVIRDTDMALEMANYTRDNLMVQSAAAMVAQANSAPGRVLRLITE